jgi:hypothetical protein
MRARLASWRAMQREYFTLKRKAPGERSGEMGKRLSAKALQ